MNLDDLPRPQHKMDASLRSLASAASAMARARGDDAERKMKDARTHFHAAMKDMTDVYKDIRQRTLKAFKGQKAFPLPKKPKSKTL